MSKLSLKQKLFGGAALVLVVLWLALSTRIITGVANREVAFGAEDTTAPDGTARVHGELDTAAVDGGVLQEVKLTGWAYAETMATDDDTAYEVVLLGEDGRYTVQAAKQHRFDLMPLFAGETVAARWMTGVNVAFSPLSMRDGDYRLGLRVREGDAAAGTVYTDTVLRKHRGRVQVEAFTSQPQQAAGEATCSSALLCNLSDAWVTDTDGETLRIAGWAAFYGQPADGQEVLLELEWADGRTERYTTLPGSDDFLAERMGADVYRRAPFTLRLPLEDGALPQSVRVLVQQGDAFAGSRPFALGAPQEDGTLPVQPPQPVQGVDVDAPADTALVSSVKLVWQDAYGWVVEGYAFRPADTQESVVYLALEDVSGKVQVVQSGMGSSPEALVLDGPDAAQSAFTCVLPLPVEELAAITPLVEAGGALHSAGRYEILRDGDAFELLHPAAQMAEDPPGDTAALEAYNIERADWQDGVGLWVKGWAVGSAPAGQRPVVEVRYEDGSVEWYDAWRDARLDIEATQGNSDARYTGFSAFIQAGGKTPVRCRVLVQAGGDWQAGGAEDVSVI